MGGSTSTFVISSISCTRRCSRTIARRFGLPGPDVDGLTLGHAVFIRRSALATELLAHECRHVQQCEAAGSLHRFLRAYLRQVARHGYRDAPFEVDARAAAKRCIGGG